MRRLLAVVLLLCSCTVDAQADERRVGTVQTDEVPEQVEPSDERTDPAEHPDEHIVLARQLVALGRDRAGDAQAAAACAAAAEAIRADLAAAYRARPGDFHGISPQSAYWPDVVHAWHAYHGDRCDDSPAAILSRSYVANMSAAELREVIAFQDSPSGRAFIAATQRARADLDNRQAARTDHDPDAASDAFRQAMQRLKAKYENEPK